MALDAARLGLRPLAVIPSPLPGPSGNREFFLWLRPDGAASTRTSSSGPSSGPSPHPSRSRRSSLFSRTTGRLGPRRPRRPDRLAHGARRRVPIHLDRADRADQPRSTGGAQ
ncbi:hypothetical protein NKG05_30230 [Oerskovia sp. M15]